MIPHQALILWRMLTAAYGTKPTWLAGSAMSGLGSRTEVRFRGPSGPGLTQN
jgi:hypothetical protein